MPIPLPGAPETVPDTAGSTPFLDDSWTPRRIVEELDRHVVGQNAAKRAVAIALRNRMRRRLLPPDIAEDVVPKNILMIGPTGVGKTEIARRLARLAGSPFVKVEATKYTEVGYVGRDVESIIRDLVETAVRLVREEEMEAVRLRAEAAAEERLLDILLPAPRPVPSEAGTHGAAPPFAADAEARDSFHRTREKMREALRAGRFDTREVTLTVRASAAPVGVFAMPGMESLDLNLQDMLPNLFPPTTQERKMTVADARGFLVREEQDRLVDMEQVGRRAIDRAEQTGIVFLDELDKVAGRESGHGPDVSREGVQRDLLPIIEGTSVRTKYGNVNTHHILFIAAGAFHVSKPSDLIPELQGRLPIRVEMEALTRADFVRILQEPKNALIKQAAALLGTEGVDLVFSDDGIEAIAEFAEKVNEATENIGARRLHTILERVLDRISFEAPERHGERIVVDADAVRGAVSDIVKDRDLSKFIL